MTDINASGKLTEITTRYLAGETTKRIARSFGVTGETVRIWLKLAGIDRRTRGAEKQYEYDRLAFSVLCPEAAYWAGLLMADGNVSCDGKTMSLELNSQDHELVLGLKRFLRYSGPVYERTRLHKSGNTSKMSAIRLTAPEIVSNLKLWGVVPRKTYRCKIPKNVTSALLNHFFRGLFDGDGCAHRRLNGSLYLSLCGNSKVIDSFRDWCWKSVRETGSLRVHANFHVVQFGGKTAEAVGSLLYKLEGPRLRRKELLVKQARKIPQMPRTEVSTGL